MSSYWHWTTPGNYQIINDLSYPKGNSVNNYILKIDYFPLNYVTVDKATFFQFVFHQGCHFSKIGIEMVIFFFSFTLIPVASLQ